ncbi:MAG TPA: hypothetical protein VJU84_20345 [Pyrinomonadaceae bacterium]|nr:hypothetical protein [Pyrinomonadaceae bacterium]
MKTFLSAILLAFFCSVTFAQPTPAQKPTPSVPQRPGTTFNLSEYGVSFRTDPRLIIMMAALEAAGFQASASGSEPSIFRAQVRKDLTDLDPDLRNRMRTFYERNKLPAPATPADQAARYVSLAFALGPPPGLDAPARSDDLPGSLLEVLDFAPLVQEFYRRSNVDDLLVTYTRAYQAEGDRLRKPTADMVSSVLSYLHTRPITTSLDRVRVSGPSNNRKNAEAKFETRQRERSFYVVPDLLGVPGAINFRVIGDEYFAVVPEGIDPADSELRRAYLQYVIDPLMVRFSREIANRREPIKQLITEREKTGAQVSPDVFLAVSRSLVAAADTRYDETRRLDNLSRDARARLAAAKDDAARKAIAKEHQDATTAIMDETAARLAEQYERGAVLAFFFADQLKGIESSGFDIANFFADMIASFDPVRESRRLNDVADARQRALTAREARKRMRNIVTEYPVSSGAGQLKEALLVKSLADIEQVMRLKDYHQAETQLKELLKSYAGEPRIFFALAQTASLAAADATDEEVQSERLKRALTNYRLAREAASPETDRALISRAHEAMGRIYAFLELPIEAAREFDAALKVGDVPGGAYNQALEGKSKLPK